MVTPIKSPTQRKLLLFPAEHSRARSRVATVFGERKVPAENSRLRNSPDGAGLAYSEWEIIMARCETCGNDYDKAFQVTMNGKTHTFDSFECAIHALAPTCANCGIHIVGHGLEKEATFFCCEHCAEAKGVSGLRDRIGVGGVIEMGSRQ
jgi:hypothetical protein